MNPTPQYSTIIDRAFDNRARSLRVALPGRVEAYDAATQKANVQPLVMDEHVDDVGDRVAELPPIVTDVPIVFPGAGAYRITWPIEAGDTVLLVFSSSSLDRWLARGGEVDPEDARHHDLSDAVAIPGLHDFAHVPSVAPTNLMVVHSPGQILLGGPDADDPVARKSDLEQLKAAIQSAAIAVGAGGAAAIATAADINANAAVPGSTWPICSPKVSVE